MDPLAAWKDLLDALTEMDWERAAAPPCGTGIWA